MAQLGRFDHTAAYTTNGQPVSGASVTIYREGAVVNAGQSGLAPLNVTVRDLGKVKAGDTVFIDTTTGTTYSVTSTTGRTVITLGGFAGTLNFSGGEVLVPVGSPPTLYNDDQGGGTTGSNVLSTSTDGLATCFMEFGAYTYIVSGGGPPALTAKLYHGRVVPSEAPGQIRYADDFATGSSTGGIQEAIDDLPTAGGHVHCSGGKVYSTSASLWMHSNVTLHLNGATIKRATGSITDADVANSGSVINVSPKGSNGTVPTSATSLSNVSLIGPGIIDGNYSNFTSLTNTNLGMFGFTARFVDGLVVDNVRFQNCLQDGLSLIENKHQHLSNLTIDTVGQWSVTSSRNGISLNNYLSTSGWAEHCTISNVTMKTVGDEAIGGSAQWNYVTINGLTVDGCDEVFEIGQNTVTPGNIKGWNVSNVSAVNTLNALIAFTGTVTGTIYSDMNFDNITMIGHATLHESFAITATATASYNRVKFSRINCTNLNSANTASARWINFVPDTNHSVDGLWITDSSFIGMSADTGTDDIGLLLRGAISNVHLSNVEFRDIPGVGVQLDDAAFAKTIQNVHCNNVVVNGSNGDGFQVVIDQVAATAKEIYFNGCKAIDCAKQTGNAGWRLGIAAAGTITPIYFRNCRSFKTSGATHLYGINFFQSAGTLGPIFLDDCDFTGVQTQETIVSGGTLTLLQCSGHFYATQAITAAATTITLPSRVKHCTIYITSDASYSLSTTPTIPDGAFDGQKLYIMNVDSGADIITLHDEATGAGCNLLNAGSTDWALNPGDNITYQWSSALSAWVQIAGENTIA